jgi:transcriptional regulator with XRE-family HTH domain
MDIGNKIKEMRLRAGLTQGELANRCELSKGYISQLENDLTSPSIVTLSDILLALGSDMGAFFKASPQEKVVFGKDDYFESSAGGVATKWLITNSQKNEMEPILITIAANGQTESDIPHEGEEFGYVLSGTLTLVLGDGRYKLGTGDSFYYAADKVHYLINAGAKTAQVIWVSSPPNF